MARAGNYHLSVTVKLETKAGDKPAVLPAKDFTIQSAKKRWRIGDFSRERVERSYREGTRHRGLQSFPAHISDHNHDGPIRLNADPVLTLVRLCRAVHCRLGDAFAHTPTVQSARKQLPSIAK